jgi:hypothetical protein
LMRGAWVRDERGTQACSRSGGIACSAARNAFDEPVQ